MTLTKSCGWCACCTAAIALMLIGFSAGGCRSASLKPDFAPVQSQVAQRLAQRVHWRQGTAEDALVDQAIAALLQQPLTLDAAVQIALLKNPSLQAAYEELGVAQADLVQAGLLRNPVLAASPQFAVSGAGTKVDLSIVGPFLELLVVPARRRLAEGQLEQARLRITQAAMEVAADTAAAFHHAQAALQMLALDTSTAEAAAMRAQAAQRRFEAGDISELDLARQRADAQQNLLAVRLAEAQVQASRAALGRMLGVPASRGWSIDSTPAAPPDAEASTDELLNRAMTYRADLAAARHDVELVDQALSLVRRGMLTQVELGAGAEREPGGSWLAGPELQLEVPIFDQWQAKVARLQAQRRQASRRVAALEADIATEVVEAHVRLQAARLAAQHLQTVVIPLRVRIAELSQQQHDALRLGVYELLAARQAELAARAEYVQSLRDYWLARVALQRAVGAAVD